jgi:hypothetical protein
MAGRSARKGKDAVAPGAAPEATSDATIDATSDTSDEATSDARIDAAIAGELGDDFADLEHALLAAAQEFSSDAQPLGELLAAMVGDVERAARERLEIIPVAHHSPASAIHMVQRLRRRPPRVVFMEMCEDLIGPAASLADASLPVALQAFAAESSAFPASWAPLSVVAPLTESSAEYQAIAFAAGNPEVELVFVDRSVDHVFQALPQTEEGLAEALPEGHDDGEHDEEGEGAALHGSAVGVELGAILPSFGEFLDFLLANARVNHFSEWWSLYVEQPTLGASYETYRRVMFLVGSLIRRLGTTRDNLESDRMRERYMWTRMKDHLSARKVAPEDAIYICGAAHAASDVPEFGIGSPERWDIPPRTGTAWLYGMLPSSFSAIELQFAHPRGTVSLAAETWKKALGALRLEPFKLSAGKTGRARKSAAKLAKPARPGRPARARKTASNASASAAPQSAADSPGELMSFLTRPPALIEQDQEQLLSWCVGVVDLARKNGYLASTADSIAIYQNALLLAMLRSRRHPSPGDFVDAAVACLEKASVPGKRSISRLCEILLGADRIGQVGYSSLPPLVQDIHDRLARLGVKPRQTTVTRSLMDFRKDPASRPCSELLWRLHYLLPGARVARPIMGELVLGGKPVQESWDIKLGGSEQRDLIQLAYEGVTVEQVLEKRLRARAFGAGATTVDALDVAEASVVLLHSARLTEDLGERAVHLLAGGLGASDAQDVFDRVRRLVHYFRSTPAGLPHWLKDFVSTGYQHYATLLPEVFADRGTRPEQVAGMLAFVFTLESLALALGCNRSQLLIAIEQAGGVTEDADKLGLLWAAEWLVDRKDSAAVRAEFDAVLDNPMSVPAYPSYLNGFLLALGFTSMVAPLGVELLGRAFTELSDSILMPWLPGLIDSLRPRAGDIMPALLKEAQLVLPRRLGDLDAWSAPWESAAPAAQGVQAVQAMGQAVEASSPEEQGARALLFAHGQAAEAYAAGMGLEPVWAREQAPRGAGQDPGQAAAGLSVEEQGARDLVLAHPAATEAYSALLGPRQA